MRLIFYVVVGVIILTLLRSVFEAVGKAFSSGASASASGGAERSGASVASVAEEGSGVRDVRVDGHGDPENQRRRDVLLLFGGVPG